MLSGLSLHRIGRYCFDNSQEEQQGIYEAKASGLSLVEEFTKRELHERHFPLRRKNRWRF